jgi:hypothetical protein
LRKRPAPGVHDASENVSTDEDTPDREGATHEKRKRNLLCERGPGSDIDDGDDDNDDDNNNDDSSMPSGGASGPSRPLRVLEVGAINAQLSRCPWLDVRAIDIHSQHPRIEEVDLFDIPPRQRYDVVVSSMVRSVVCSSDLIDLICRCKYPLQVVNCVPEGDRRLEMLMRYPHFIPCML